MSGLMSSWKFLADLTQNFAMVCCVVNMIIQISLKVNIFYPYKTSFYCILNLSYMCAPDKIQLVKTYYRFTFIG